MPSLNGFSAGAVGAWARAGAESASPSMARAQVDRDGAIRVVMCSSPPAWGRTALAAAHRGQRHDATLTWNRGRAEARRRDFPSPCLPRGRVEPHLGYHLPPPRPGPPGATHGTRRGIGMARNDGGISWRIEWWLPALYAAIAGVWIYG